MVFDRYCVKELQLKGLDELLQILGVEVPGVGREVGVLKEDRLHQAHEDSSYDRHQLHLCEVFDAVLHLHMTA